MYLGVTFEIALSLVILFSNPVIYTKQGFMKHVPALVVRNVW